MLYFKHYLYDYMRKVYLLLALITLFVTLANGQAILNQNEHRQRLGNGLSLFYTHVAGTSSYEMVLTFRFGAVIEDTTNDGLAYVCYTAFLNGLQEQLQKVDNKIKVDGRFGFENSTYKFTVPVAQLKPALDAIGSHYAQTPDTTDITIAIFQNAALFSVLQNTLLYPAELELIKRHWNTRSSSLSLYGPIPMVDSITIAKVAKLYREGFCIEFAQLAFTGPEPFRIVWSTVQDKLSYISSCPGELFNTKLANLYPAPGLSSQLVYGVGTATPTRYQKLYQGPYLSFDPQSCIAALVLKQLLTQSTSLAALRDSLSISKLLLAYDPMHYTASMTWHLFPNPDSLHLAYTNLDTIFNLIGTNKVFTASEIEDAKMVVLKQYQSILNNPSQKLYLVSQYWANNTIPWLANFPDALKAVNQDQIAKVINNYVLGHKYTTLLLLNDADTLAYDFNQFTTTYTNVDSIRFNFKKNTAQFVSGQDDSILSAFRQTLLINRDFVVTINAQAYKSEILKVKDDSLTADLKQYKGFYIYPQSIVADNKSYRLDIYRAATLIVKLLKAGVDPSQLKGTGNLMKGRDDEQYQITVSPVFNKKKL